MSSQEPDIANAENATEPAHVDGQLSVEQRLRPYAEFPCPGPGVEATSHEIDCKGGCGGSGLDPLYAALRGEHVIDRGIAPSGCRICGLNKYDEQARAYCLRTDLGALVRVAAACGLFVTMGVYSKDSGFYEVELSKFFKSEGKWRADALEVEDALAAALVAALPELAS